MDLDLNERQRFALRWLASGGRGKPAALGRVLQDRFGATMGNLSASRRYGPARAGLNTLRALERRGLVVEAPELWRGGASTFLVTEAGRREAGEP
jgi:hypothetical protein